jgi:phosphatidylserine decarboxylase
MMTLAQYGKREWGGGGIAALVLIGTGIFIHGPSGWVLVAVTTLLWLALAAFFRVPTRSIPQAPELILAPADGVVKSIDEVADHGIECFKDQSLLRIGIFLSVLDVHVNRAPCDLTVHYRRYKEGHFHDARDPRCAKENESLVIAGMAQTAGKIFPMAIRQISGAIARRIVCDPEPGTELTKGEIYGMIKFGSRTELYLSTEDGIIPSVQIGDKVRSGTTIMARINT